MIKLLMIQPKNPEINRFWRLQFNDFSQITITYLAAFVDERYYDITLIDEYCQRVNRVARLQASIKPCLFIPLFALSDPII